MEITIDALSSGDYDMAGGGVLYTKERDEILDFSDDYLQMQTRIAILADNNNIKSITDSDKYKIGCQESTIGCSLLFDSSLAKMAVEYRTNTDLLKALENKEIDGFIFDDYIDNIIDVPINIKLLDQVLNADKLAIPFPKGSELIDKINKGLKAMKSSGEIEKLLGKYFSKNFNITYDDIGDGAYKEEEVEE